MKVLIAEDAMISRLMLEEWLTSWGYQPISANDGEQAWNIIMDDKANAPRLALLDWMMPNMDGIELCQKIKNTDKLPFIYVILLTSKNSKEDIVTGLDAGADDFLSKPVQPEELRSRLNVGTRILDYQRRLLELDEQKNKFLGMAAHDLRNPLTSIIGFSQLLLNTPLDENGKREFLNIINQVSNEMLLTLNDLLDISVIESGKFDLHVKDHDLVELIAYRIRLISLTAQQKNIYIEANLPEKLPLSFDKDRIGQAIDNLVSNAIKYSPKNTTIRVQLLIEEQQAKLSVQDEGSGIPLDKQHRLFGDFSKLGSKPTGGEKSTGLGLAIVKRIIEAHGGQVGVMSEPQKGSCFFFTLPLSDDIKS
jgi:two-component system, sensor histidine kinase and response regulator